MKKLMIIAFLLFGISYSYSQVNNIKFPEDNEKALKQKMYRAGFSFSTASTIGFSAGLNLKNGLLFKGTFSCWPGLVGSLEPEDTLSLESYYTNSGIEVQYALYRRKDERLFVMLGFGLFQKFDEKKPSSSSSLRVGPAIGYESYIARGISLEAHIGVLYHYDRTKQIKDPFYDNVIDRIDINEGIMLGAGIGLNIYF